MERISPMSEETRVRVVKERTDLEEKIRKLGEFIISPSYRNLSVPSQNLLFRQWFFMKEYSNVIRERLKLDDKERKVSDGNE